MSLFGLDLPPLDFDTSFWTPSLDGSRDVSFLDEARDVSFFGGAFGCHECPSSSNFRDFSFDLVWPERNQSSAAPLFVGDIMKKSVSLTFSFKTGNTGAAVTVEFFFLSSSKEFPSKGFTSNETMGLDLLLTRSAYEDNNALSDFNRCNFFERCRFAAFDKIFCGCC
jgi:hypothetical protein